MGPFDRFNDRAKRILALAQDEAIRFNHNYIGPEHLLLGLVREGEGVAANALRSLGVELAKVRTAVEFMVGRGTATTSPSEITLHPRTKKIIELAIDEARKLGHSHVGTEHLLLGLAREGGSLADEVLGSLGVTLEKVRHQVIATLGQQASGTDSPSVQMAAPTRVFMAGEWARTGPFDRLDNDCDQAMTRAYWEAGRRNHESIGPDHLLLGLVRSESEWLRRVWQELAIDRDVLVSKIGAAIPARDGAPPARLLLSTSLTELAARASALAAQRGSALVRPEHLLLAIAGEGGASAATLASLGATPDRIREAVDKLKG